MPEELRDLMDRATEGTVPPVDADAVWKRGSRQRRTRAVLYAAPIVVLLALVAGLLVVAAGNDDSDDTTVADLTPEQQQVVDQYLGVLESEGTLADFPDDRAAVEYALRVDCFGVVSPQQLDALGAATTDVVHALTAEGVASAGWYYELATVDDIGAARADSNAAIDAWRAVVAELPQPAPGETIGEATVWETADTRLEDLPTIRQAIDDVQMAGVNAGEQLNATTEALVEVLADATTRTSDTGTFREWDQQVRLLLAERTLVPTTFIALGAAEGIGPDVSRLDEGAGGYPATFDLLAGSVAAEDEAIKQWDDSAPGELKSVLRNATSTQEVREHEAFIERILSDLETATLPAVEPASLFAAAENKAAALASVASAAADMATSGESAVSELDAAVSDACDATDDAILDVEPAAVEQ
jgi:hypothetical protein